MPPQDERTVPTQSVVDALQRSAIPPAFALEKAAMPRLVELPEAVRGNALHPAATARFLGATGDRERAIDCLAAAAWYEAGNDAESQQSVIQVILNRVAHPSFPKSVCGVVFQGSERSTGCQFTFTCDGSMLRRRPSAAAMARARAVAELALQGAVLRPVVQATHYHADYVQPWWSRHLVSLGKVGRHIFYRWPGQRGALAKQPSSAGEAEFALLARQRPKLPATGDVASAGADETEAQLATVAPVIGGAAPGASASRQGDALFLAVDLISPSGRWAVSALGKCAGRTGCRVLGYESPDKIARNSTRPAAALEKPVFLFIRDPASGMELALWDCDKVSRPASSQCLPDAGQDLARLLRERQS
jgi:spore germination cell wall hydrolase CwlJ-like protein